MPLTFLHGKASISEILVDTGPLVGWINKRDQWHDWSVSILVDLLPDHVPHIRALSAKYREMDFCDAAMVRLSEIFPKANLITTDTAHFQIYRRFQNQTILLIHP